MTGLSSFLKQAPTARTGADDPTVKPLTVLLVDDEPDVHQVTRLVLGNFAFEGRPLRFVSAYSGAEAVDALRRHPDTALMLLDVVMEYEQAGLDVVRRVREELGNRKIRILLRTGEPGAAPQADVIARYDINGYANKTELTQRQLETQLYASLRAFRDIETIESQLLTIERGRRELERVVEASAAVAVLESSDGFAQGVLEQMTGLIGAEDSRAVTPALYQAMPGLIASRRQGDFIIIAGTGRYGDKIGAPITSVLTPEQQARITARFARGRGATGPDDHLAVFPGDGGSGRVLYLETGSRPKISGPILDLFERDISVAFRNIDLRDMIADTQREIVYRLGGAVESRSKETANHVKRVAKLSKYLALAYGLSEREAEILRHASPLHDIGKIGIPDHILNKAGPLTAEEWQVMRSHPVIGYELLRDSPMEILRAGAEISLEHHEKWDGSGYPYGKRGLEIGLYGRITALIDVFDALRSRRCYKEPWPDDQVFAHIRAQSGQHFDPALVDLMFAHLEELVALADRYPD